MGPGCPGQVKGEPSSPPPLGDDPSLPGALSGSKLERPEREMSKKRDHAVSQGISFGSALAIAISWSTHHSILWAILHGFFSWFYVIYYAITR
jgi:hypothetical protein